MRWALRNVRVALRCGGCGLRKHRAYDFWQKEPARGQCGLGGVMRACVLSVGLLTWHAHTHTHMLLQARARLEVIAAISSCVSRRRRCVFAVLNNKDPIRQQQRVRTSS